MVVRRITLGITNNNNNNNNNDTIISLPPIINEILCEGSEGSEGIRRCATTFFKKNYNDFELDKSEIEHKFIQNESIILNKNIENSKTYIELPSQPSHPHICAQFSVRVFSVPSQPSQHSNRIINNNDNDTTTIESGLDFILSHFLPEEPFLFPRKISTYKSNNKQFLIRTREEVINAFRDSNFVDCRINAYPSLTDYQGIQRYKPNFIFIDIDKNNFKTDRSFKLALYNTLKNIKEKLLDNNAYPTVIETGGGYHVYQPIYCPTALENVTEFSGFDRPSVQFLRFAKDYLSNGKADKNSNPSFKSCLLRIPGSINSKYCNTTKVKIIQQWNGYRPHIPREFVEEFRTCMIQKKIDEQTKQNRQKIMLLRLKERQQNNDIKRNYYEWIEEKILANPFPDCRKIIVDLILAPYLINIKKMSYDESYHRIKQWLNKCNDLRKLDNYNNFVNNRIHSALKTATQKGIGPMNFYKIKTDSRYNTNLYLLIYQKGKR